MSYIVTGGCGFIGSNFVNYLCNVTDNPVFVIDKMTYAASEDNIDLKHLSSGQVRLYKCDLALGCDALDKILEHNEVHGIFHFAAESHVDNSITGPRAFIDANILGTFNLLEAIRTKDIQCRYLHISTDEVYGELGEEGSFTEDSHIAPNSPYSASKAAADMLCRSFYQTYGYPIIITRCTNNYGLNQHDEKLIPQMIKRVKNDEKLPVYGSGKNVRDWVHVQDHCEAIDVVLHKGENGEVYNIGSGCEERNIDIVKMIIKELGKSEDLIEYVDDRLGHDWRYSIDSTKIQNELGWKPKMNFNKKIKELINGKHIN